MLSEEVDYNFIFSSTFFLEFMVVSFLFAFLLCSYDKFVPKAPVAFYNILLFFSTWSDMSVHLIVLGSSSFFSVTINCVTCWWQAWFFWIWGFSRGRAHRTGFPCQRSLQLAKNGGDCTADRCTALWRWLMWMMLVHWARAWNSGSRTGRANVATSKARLRVSWSAACVLRQAFDPCDNPWGQDIHRHHNHLN